MNEEQQKAAKEIAQYILDGDGERDSYQEYIEEGGDPRHHVYYLASVVMGREKEFFDDIKDFLLR